MKGEIVTNMKNTKKITILLLILASLFLIACGKDEKKDDTEMAEKEFFAKIDRSMKSKRTKVTIEELRAKYL